MALHKAKRAVEEKVRESGIAYTILRPSCFMEVWLSPMLGFDPAKVKEALGLPEHVMIPAMISIGRGDEEGFTHHRHSLKRIVSYR